MRTLQFSVYMQNQCLASHYEKGDVGYVKHGKSEKFIVLRIFTFHNGKYYYFYKSNQIFFHSVLNYYNYLF